MTLVVSLLDSAALENSLYQLGGNVLLEFMCGNEQSVFRTEYLMGLVRNAFSIIFVTEGPAG